MDKEKVVKVAPLSEKATEILEFLKGRPTEEFTLAEIKENVEGANSAHLTALRTRNLVDSQEVEIVQVKTSKAKVLRYAVKGE